MKNKLSYILIVLTIGLMSCEDKYKSELDQINKDLAAIKAENEDLKNQNSNLEKNNAELAKKNQVIKLDNLINWYVKTNILNHSYELDFEDVSIKNIFENQNLTKTIIRYHNGTRKGYHHTSTQETLNHSVDKNGVLLKSQSPNMLLEWNWEDGNNVKVLIKTSEEYKELHSDSNNNINRVIGYNDSKKKISEQIIEYNEADMPTSYIYKDANNVVVTGIYYTYNSNNQITNYRHQRNFADDKNEFNFDYEYDSQNRLIKISTKKDLYEGDEIEKTFSYVNGYSITTKNISKDKVEITKYSDTTEENLVYTKEENNKYNFTNEQFFDNGLISKKIKSEFHEENTVISTSIFSYKNDGLDNLTNTTITTNKDNVTTDKTIKTYSDIIFKEEYKIGLYTDTYCFKQYIIQVEELRAGKMQIVSKLKRTYKKQDYGNYILESEINLLK
ncbi:MAG: hypothetical protein N4A49_10475 [Marinifilaceae bacterium]|jgi:hypothetical protein|nr:hypothetical protein [Marinifilaceae bacterium]